MIGLLEIIYRDSFINKINADLFHGVAFAVKEICISGYIFF